VVDAVMAGRYAGLAHLLTDVAEHHRNRQAFVDGSRELTFGGWSAAAGRFAAHLSERGVRAGDVVLIALPSGIDFAIAYAAVLWTGAVATAVNPRLGPDEVGGIIARSRPTAALEPDGGDPRVPAGSVAIRVSLADLVRAGTAEVWSPPAAVAHTDPAVIVWTSGTTGAPKGAWFDYTALAAGARVSGLLSAPFDRRLMPTPFAHAGFMTRVWDQLAYVMTTIITPTPWSAETMLAAMTRERVTVGQGVPTQWEKLLALPELSRETLPQLRIVGTGAARVPAELVRALRERLRCPIVVRYAATEVPSMTGTRAEDPAEVLEHTVGRPQDGIEIRIVDEAGRSVPHGTVGRLAARSPFQMRGYWHDAEQTAAALGADGWFLSSDLGRLDEAGNVTLAGRASEAYIRGGYNVYPLEVENVLTAHPGIAAAAVVGVPAPVIGEIGVAWIVLRDGTPLDAGEVRRWVADRIADYKVPDRVEFVAELPLTSMMKVDKLTLARRSVAADLSAD
jgi:acyl-CoA synthetase (AMP-forming)/AMP-acid ligase II